MNIHIFFVRHSLVNFRFMSFSLHYSDFLSYFVLPVAFRLSAYSIIDSYLYWRICGVSSQLKRCDLKTALLLTGPGPISVISYLETIFDI